MRTINASELGAYLYCHRAWWYRQQGLAPGNQAALLEGAHQHHAHGRSVFLSGALRILGWVLLAVGLVALTLTLLGVGA